MFTFEQPPNNPDIAILLWRKKWLIFAGAVIGLLVAILYLNGATYRYRAELRVTPSATSKTSNLANAGNNVGSLASLAGISIGGTTAATPFDLFMDAILSRDVADQLSRDQYIMHTLFRENWDVAGKRWREPKSISVSIMRSAQYLVGMPRSVWQPPNGSSLQKYLQLSVKIYKGNNVPITRIQYDHEDKQFAVYLLGSMYKNADLKVRGDALKQAKIYAAYLARRLPEVEIAELRQSIIEQLSKQEELTMMASSAVPYAAIPLEAPSVPENPDNPRARIVLPLGLLAGAAAGVLSILLLAQRVRQRVVRDEFEDRYFHDKEGEPQ